MSKTLQEQKDWLEGELAKTGDKAVSGTQRAIYQKELTSVKRKLTTQAQRTTVLKDGTRIGAASKVYTWHGAWSYEYKPEDGPRLPVIYDKTVHAVSPDGSRVCLNDSHYRGHSWDGLESLYGSPASALTAAVKSQAYDVRAAETNLRGAQEKLAREQADLAAVQTVTDASILLYGNKDHPNNATAKKTSERVAREAEERRAEYKRQREAQEAPDQVKA